MGSVDGCRLLADEAALLHHSPHPGENPSETALAELFVPLDEGCGSRGIALTTDGVVWTVPSSGHKASFDRKKCTRPINGPDALSGKLCPEGWTLYKFSGPQFKGVTDQGSAEDARYIWVDRFNTLGLGENVPITSTNGGESLTAIADGKFVTLRVPCPMGFFTKNAGGRSERRLEGQGTVDHLRHPHQLPRRGRCRGAAEGYSSCRSGRTRSRV
jgi:hypothetical protein